MASRGRSQPQRGAVGTGPDPTEPLQALHAPAPGNRRPVERLGEAARSQYRARKHLNAAALGSPFARESPYFIRVYCPRGDASGNLCLPWPSHPLGENVSLLSELIAQLRALIEHSNETMTSVRSARDVVETTAPALQAALSDSSHSAAHDGLAQWQTALEKLDEAQTLLLAGNAAMDSYITGPLLGGSTGPAAGAPKQASAAQRQPRTTKSHGAQQKRAGIMKGPVRFSVPRGLADSATPEHRRQAQEYVDAGNKVIADGIYPKKGRVRPSKDPVLKAAKLRAAEKERARAEKAGEPYGDKAAAHLPDTTWTGTADPPGGWGRHDAVINHSLGSQSDKYPEGYVAERFELDRTWDQAIEKNSK